MKIKYMFVIFLTCLLGISVGCVFLERGGKQPVSVMKGGDRNGISLIRAHQIEPLDRRDPETLKVKDWLMERNYSILKKDNNYRLYIPDDRGSIPAGVSIRREQNGIIKITIKDVGSGIFIVDRKVVISDEKPKEPEAQGVTTDEKPKEVFEPATTTDEKPKE